MKYILLLLGLLSIHSCGTKSAKNGVDAATSQNQQIIRQDIPIDSISGAYLSLDKKRYDFGKVSRKKTPNIPIEFEVANMGKVPLVILKVDVSCGCLSVDYPKNPIQSGKKAKLTINVDTKNQDGVFNKAVFIKSNADNDVELIRIVGEVKK